MNKGCEVCQPSVRGYTVVVKDSFAFQQLCSYIEKQGLFFRMSADCTLWLEEAAFFNMMDVIQRHKAMAAPSRPLNPLRWEGELQEIAAFTAQRDAYWIDRLIEAKSITTYYQPIVQVEAGTPQIVGHELLARGLNEKGEIISPYHLFTAARVRNRLFSLDRLCRLEAIRNAGPVAEGMLFINFIPTTIYVPEHCLQSTFALVQELNLEASQIVFEVVETDDVTDIRHLKRILEYYRKHGFRYALDDVGTGYNQIDRIQQLEPDIVKLAMECVQGIHQDQAKQQAAKEIAELTHRLGGRVLAEGIETAEDFHCLQELGYDFFQGYYLSKPQPEPVKQLYV